MTMPKRFQEYLTEAPQWTEKVFRRVTDSNAEQWIPVSNSMITRLIRTQPETIAYHVMGKENLRNFASLEGTRKPVSCTTIITTSFVNSGVWSGYGYCAKIRGKMLTYGMSDIMTVPDDNGRRWISPRNMTYALRNDDGKNLDLDTVTRILNAHNKVEDAMWELRSILMKKYIKELNITEPIRGLDTENIRLSRLPLISKNEIRLNRQWSPFCEELDDYVRWQLKPSAKELLYRFIKDYIDGVEQFLSKLGEDVVRDVLGFTLPKVMSGGFYNEAIINEFTILSVYISDYKLTEDDIKEARSIFKSGVKFFYATPDDDSKSKIFRDFVGKDK